MSDLDMTLEDRFHQASNDARLKALFNAGDYHGLLEYALLLSQAEAASRTRIRWILKDASRAWPTTQDYLQIAKDMFPDAA